MKKSIIIMVLMAFANIAIAKTLVTLQQLQGIWQRTEDTYKVDTQTWTFKKTSFIVENKYVYKDKIDTSKYETPYYLSKGVLSTNI